MATIHSLPQETVREIIRAAPALDTKDPYHLARLRVSDRYRFLCATTRVCSAWRTISQEELWKDVVLSTEQGYRSFAEVAHLFPVQRMYLNGDEVDREEGGDALETVLESVHGVGELVIGCMDTRPPDPQLPFCIDWINHRGFKGLKSLALRSIELDIEDSPSSLPFGLEALVLSDITTRGNYLARPFLLNQSIPSLTSLALDTIYTDAVTDADNSSLIAVAPQLITLIIGLDTDGDDSLSFLPFLEACTRLRHLTMGRTDSPVSQINDLEVALETLDLHDFKASDQDLAELVDLIDDEILGVSSLKSLSIGMQRSGPTGRLGQICREKGIQLLCY